MSRPNLPDLFGLTILVVDDNGDHLDLLATYLRACRAEVLEARNALAALAYVDTTPKIDALLTDLTMSSMDGVELARRVRQRPGRQSLPVIALTAFQEDYIDSPKRDFNAFLHKPVNFDELCRTIREVTRR